MDKLAQVSQASIYPSNNKVFYKLKTNFSRFLFHCGKNESKIELEICWDVRLIRFFLKEHNLVNASLLIASPMVVQ